MLEIVAGGMRFVARFEDELAPLTVAAFRGILPFDDRIIHCRWSGEANWIPGGARGTELLFPYGYGSFASKAGHLAANHFATLVEGQDQLRELGRMTLWE